MKKSLFVLAVILGVTMIAFSVAVTAFAAGPVEIDRGGPGGGGGGGAGGAGGGYGGDQSETTPDASNTTSDMINGNGHHSWNGTGTGIPVNQNINLDGALSDAMHESLATALGISTEKLTARVDAGETLFLIAISLGFDETEIRDMLTTARTDALAQAVVDGLITQEEADWLASRGNRGGRR
jgi:hypothetical protein